MDKGSGSGIFPDPDPGDPNRPDPDSDLDPQHWFRQHYIFIFNVNNNFDYSNLKDISK